MSDSTRPNPICKVEVDSAEFIGDDTDGVYVTACQGPDGWYASGMIDSETGFVQELVHDVGPFPTEGEAMAEIRGLAREWCIENEVEVAYDREPCRTCDG